MNVFPIRARPRHPAPPLFLTLAQLLSLASPVAQRWWDAVVRSQWTATVSWRQALVLFDEGPAHAPDAVWAFFQAQCAPPRVMALLEDLQRERLLPRQDVAAIGECLLARLDRDGGYTSREQNR